MKEKRVISSYIAAVESIDATFLLSFYAWYRKEVHHVRLPEILDVAAKILPKVPQNFIYFIKHFAYHVSNLI